MGQISATQTIRPALRGHTRCFLALLSLSVCLSCLPAPAVNAQEILGGELILGEQPLGEVIISEVTLGEYPVEQQGSSDPIANEVIVGESNTTNVPENVATVEPVAVDEVVSPEGSELVTKHGDLGTVVPKQQVVNSNSLSLPKQTQPVGMDSGLWEWTPLAPHHQSIVEVTCNGGVGTGVVIEIDKEKRISDGHEGYVLTAWHVVEDDNGEGQIKVSYRSGIGAKKCRIVHADEQKDIALLWVWVPDGIPAAKLGTDPIEAGNSLEFAGLGGGSQLKCCIRHFSATASSPSSLEKIFADVPLLPGDSGGPVFNEKHEVVGIISGGWFWFNSGVISPSGNSIRTTWPARASNIGPIQTLMAKLGESDEASTTIK